MEKDVYSFWLWVQQEMLSKDIQSFRDLERRAGLSNGSISSRKNDLKLPTVEMAQALTDALGVTWVKLWSEAGIVSQVDPSQLKGLDAEIYQSLQGTGDDFKLAVLKTIKTWLVLYEELKKWAIRNNRLVS